MAGFFLFTSKMSLILGIESSCDETSCAIVRDGRIVVANTLATSSEMHQKTGGVIPEQAARMQVESIIPVISETLTKANLQPNDLDAVAVTVGPGLIGSLIVGVETAKALSLAWNKPLIPVNHLVGHIYGNFIDKDPSEIDFPAVVLIVSGGHTDLVLMKGHGDFEYIGGTLDDAAGEAFDKSARTLGLAAFMGGPHISKAAKNWEGKSSSFTFKRPMLDSNDYKFSFSGIKTAVITKVNAFKEMGEVPVDEISYEFQEAVTDVLYKKTIKATLEHQAKSVMLAGGVSANTVLREKFKNALSETEIKLFIPPIELCTDSAIYIAASAHFNFHKRDFDQVRANPSLSIMDEV